MLKSLWTMNLLKQAGVLISNVGPIEKLGVGYYLACTKLLFTDWKDNKHQAFGLGSTG